jgi:DivIVA domain-containing protein
MLEVWSMTSCPRRTRGEKRSPAAPEQEQSFGELRHYVPQDILDVSFPVSVRGYDRRAVDAYIKRVNRVIAELKVRASPPAAVRHALEQAEEKVQGLLQAAREAAEEITASAQQEAEESTARAKAEGVHSGYASRRVPRRRGRRVSRRGSGEDSLPARHLSTRKPTALLGAFVNAPSRRGPSLTPHTK